MTSRLVPTGNRKVGKRHNDGFKLLVATFTGFFGELLIYKNIIHMYFVSLQFFAFEWEQHLTFLF